MSYIEDDLGKSPDDWDNAMMSDDFSPIYEKELGVWTCPVCEMSVTEKAELDGHMCAPSNPVPGTSRFPGLSKPDRDFDVPQQPSTPSTEPQVTQLGFTPCRVENYSAGLITFSGSDDGKTLIIKPLNSAPSTEDALIAERDMEWCLALSEIGVAALTNCVRHGKINVERDDDELPTASTEDGAMRAAIAVRFDEYAAVNAFDADRRVAEIIRQHCPAPPQPLTDEEFEFVESVRRGVGYVGYSWPYSTINSLLAIIDRIAPGGGK